MVSGAGPDPGDRNGTEPGPRLVLLRAEQRVQRRRLQPLRRDRTPPGQPTPMADQTPTPQLPLVVAVRRVDPGALVGTGRVEKGVRVGAGLVVGDPVAECGSEVHVRSFRSGVRLAENSIAHTLRTLQEV